MTIHPAYCIDGPALVSFSGGRTSAYMLHEITRAHDGKLPDDVYVCFANTGKEREETLHFVQECGSRWGVRIQWLEWRDTTDGFEEVGFNSASRAGEPFAALIAKKNFLPNAVTRYCTSTLKVRTISSFAKQALGWKHWTSVIGLRYDEGHRVLKAIDRNEQRKDPWRTVMPLSKAKIIKADVLAFWARQPFDLALKSYEGNCDLCFLKARAKLAALMRENPGMEGWWIEQEASIAPNKPSGARFVTEYAYADLARQVREQGHLFDGFVDDNEEHDAECGLTCMGAVA
ncbi:MAG: phosphoadenosine phosphosulfate reductase family protein [Hyphomicrobiaceae bacterium]|nr:MAG: phosphoadenosine phosphosulfate reductase family protein [Hyphomicrobiaceae bacterium]